MLTAIRRQFPYLAVLAACVVLLSVSLAVGWTPRWLGWSIIGVEAVVTVLVARKLRRDWPA